MVISIEILLAFIAMDIAMKRYREFVPEKRCLIEKGTRRENQSTEEEGITMIPERIATVCKRHGGSA